MVSDVAGGLLALSDRGAGVPLRELALVGLTAAMITYFATGWVRVLARRLGAVAYPRERDVHQDPTPRMGGLAMYIGVVAAVLLASQLPALTRGFVYSSGMPAVVVAGGLIMAIGLIDDRWGLDALTKFAGQITAASVLVTMGVAWSVLYIPIGGVGTIVLDQVSSILLTLALTVAIVNAMNFVDGLDGLAAGLGLITASAICIFSIGLQLKVGLALVALIVTMPLLMPRLDALLPARMDEAEVFALTCGDDHSRFKAADRLGLLRFISTFLGSSSLSQG